MIAMQPIKIVRRSHNDLIVFEIQGLNIFYANKVSIDSDPCIRFFDTLATQSACSAHIGILSLEGDTPEEVFGDSKPTGAYEIVPVGIYGGTFYQDESSNVGLFFQHAESFLSGTSSSNLSYIISCDAAAIYVHPKLRENAVISVIQPVFHGHENWLAEMIGIYDFVITSSGDGWLIKMYTQTEMTEDQLHSLLVEASASITSSEWFQANNADLVWDAVDMCLKLQPA